MLLYLAPEEKMLLYCLFDKCFGERWSAENPVLANALIGAVALPLCRETKRALKSVAAKWWDAGAVAQLGVPQPTAQQGVAPAQAASPSAIDDSPHSESPLMHADAGDFALPPHMVDFDDEVEEAPQVQAPRSSLWRRFVQRMGGRATDSPTVDRHVV